jgi:hypothetical protein
MASEDRLTLAKAIAKANLRCTELGLKTITTNSLKIVMVLNGGVRICWRLWRSSA